MVSCGVRLSEVGLSEIRKPQVRFLSRQSNSMNFKAEEGPNDVGSPALHKKMFTQSAAVLPHSRHTSALSSPGFTPSEGEV